MDTFLFIFFYVINMKMKSLNAEKRQKSEQSGF